MGKFQDGASSLGGDIEAFIEQTVGELEGSAASKEKPSETETKAVRKAG